MIRPKNQTEDLLLSITKNCETLIEQTHRKAEETLEFKMTKLREIFHFTQPIQIEGDWMLGLTSLKVYKSIFNLTEENNFQLSADSLDSEFSFTELKDKIAELLDLSHITDQDSQHKTTGPDIIQAYRELSIEERQTDRYYFLLLNYTQSPFREFETYLGILTGLKEDDIQLILKQYNSKVITYEISPGIYTFKDISKDLSRGFEKEFEIRGEIQPTTKYDKSDSIIIEYDINTMKTKLIVSHKINALRFDEKSFFSTILGFPPYWDYKSYKEYVGEKIINLSTIDKNHLKCDVIDGSVVNGSRQPILYRFVSDSLQVTKYFARRKQFIMKK